MGETVSLCGWGLLRLTPHGYTPSTAHAVLKVIGSSTKVHVVDALAITGEEGRGSLRKAAGSWQTSIDPQMSEWGNPTLA